MEELGIGRPSTYAATLEVLQRPRLCALEKKRLMPEDKGRLVTAFLESFFRRYVEYDFTADLEEKLDHISNGELSWKEVLRDFWSGFIGAVDDIKDLRVAEVLDALNDMLGPHIFPPRADGGDPRQCPTCGTGRLNLKLGKFGAFVGCSNYPECRYTRPLCSGYREPAPTACSARIPRPAATSTSRPAASAPTSSSASRRTTARREAEAREHPEGISPGDVDLEPRADAPVAAARDRHASGDAASRSPPASAATVPSSTTTRHMLRLKPATRCSRRPQPRGDADRGKGREGPEPRPVRRRSRQGARRSPRRWRGHGDERPLRRLRQAGGVNATIPSDKDKDTITLAEAIALIDERAAKGGGKKREEGSEAEGRKSAKPAKAEADADVPKPRRKRRPRRPPSRNSIPSARRARRSRRTRRPRPQDLAAAAKTTAKKSAGKARGK